MTSAPLPGYPPVPDGLRQIMRVFGAFEFVEQPNGLVTPDPDWERVNLARMENVPVLNQAVVCHRKIALPLRNAFHQMLEANLAGAIKTCEGCYWPRHKMHDPGRGLSVHTWGIAIDLNAATNQPGCQGDMNERVIRIFSEHGFYWGGHFGDPMHFQYAVGY
jgi:hypothetical protein